MCTVIGAVVCIVLPVTHIQKTVITALAVLFTTQPQWTTCICISCWCSRSVKCEAQTGKINVGLVLFCKRCIKEVDLNVRFSFYLML